MPLLDSTGASLNGSSVPNVEKARCSGNIYTVSGLPRLRYRNRMESVAIKSAYTFTGVKLIPHHSFN